MSHVRSSRQGQCDALARPAIGICEIMPGVQRDRSHGDVSVSRGAVRAWVLDKVADYRRRAAECRNLARRFPIDDHQKQLLDIADALQRLADEREAQIERQPSKA